MSPGASHGDDRAPWAVARVFYPAGLYEHPPAGLLQLRLVRRGSSYADIDLGGGARRVFTRPGDLLLSLPDRPTAFVIDDARELTMLQVAPAVAVKLVRQCGARSLEDLTPLLRRPVRDPLIAELLRRLDGDTVGTDTARQWALGVVFASLVRLAGKLAADGPALPLSEETLAALLARMGSSLNETWTVDRLADEAGLSRRAFAAAFKQATGVPVHQYLLRMRADRAVELLCDSDLPLAEVAHQSGFAHQAHLTRVLNRLKGATPGQIRAAGPP